MRPHEDALEHLRRRVVREEARERVRHGRPAGRPLVQPERDADRVPEEQGHDDARDQREDEVGLAEVAALEAARAAGPCGSQNAIATPTRTRRRRRRRAARTSPGSEPAERRAAERSRGRRSPTTAMKIVGKRTRKPQKMKACIEPRDEPLEELRCPSTIVGLVADARGRSRRAVDGLARPHEPGEEAARGARTASPRPRSRRRARPRTRRSPTCSASRTFRSSAVIAGTISCRSPITA